MRTIKVEYTLYEYDELSEVAKTKAIDDRISIWLEVINVNTISKDSNYYKAYEKCETMHTPWFFKAYVVEYCKEEIEDELRQYEFLEDGTIYN